MGVTIATIPRRYDYQMITVVECYQHFARNQRTAGQRKVDRPNREAITEEDEQWFKNI